MAFFSTDSSAYASQINKLKKPEYESKYGSLIDDTLNKILNKESFSYDFNADPLYQQYKDQYTKLGKEASMNAAASASALTGGYANSYAGTAASQANQQYLTQLNDKIPELYDAAMKKWQMENENLYNQFGALETEEGRLYGMHRDDVSDYYSDWNALQNGYNVALNQENANRDYDYKVSRDAVADAQWQKQYDYQVGRDAVSDSQWEKNYNYQVGRDAVSDSHWQQEFDTKNAQWQKEYELALKKARSGSSGGSGSKKSSDTNNASMKINGSSQRFITNDKDGKISERAQTILNAARKSDDPLGLLEQIAASDSNFTMGDLEYFMKELGLI